MLDSSCYLTGWAYVVIKYFIVFLTCIVCLFYTEWMYAYIVYRKLVRILHNIYTSISRSWHQVCILLWHTFSLVWTLSEINTLHFLSCHIYQLLVNVSQYVSLYRHKIVSKQKNQGFVVPIRNPMIRYKLKKSEHMTHQQQEGWFLVTYNTCQKKL